jgi:hypothetical protein
LPLQGLAGGGFSPGAQTDNESVTAIWQLCVLPSRPQYGRATPPECAPFF